MHDVTGGGSDYWQIETMSELGDGKDAASLAELRTHWQGSAQLEPRQTTMNQHDRAILDHVFRSMPTDIEQVDFGELSVLGRAALSMGAPPATVVQWYKSNRGEPEDRVDNLLFLLVDEPAVADLIDGRIAGGDGEGLIEDLVRAGVPWAHPKLDDYLDGPARTAAAWLLAETGNEALWEALDADTLDAEDAIDMVRPGALLGIGDLWSVTAGFRDDVELGDFAARIDSLLCCIEPDAYMRRVLQGRSTHTWLGHAISVADAMHAYGATTWLDTLAILEGTRAWDAFEFAASLAIAGLGLRTDPVEQEEAEELVMLLMDVDAAEEATGDPRFAFATSMADDADLQSLYVECAAHEELLRSGFGSPGLAGLPLSGGLLDDDAIEAAIDFLDQVADFETIDDDYAVGTVRTLCDLAYWAFDEAEKVGVFGPVVERLREHSHTSVKVAAEQAHTAMTGDEPQAHGEVAAFIELLRPAGRPQIAELLESDGCLAMATIERLAALGDEWHAEQLVTAWTSGAFIRSDVARMALRDALASSTSE